MSRSVLLSLTINDDPVEVAVSTHATLLEVVRYQLDLIGSKQGCDSAPR